MVTDIMDKEEPLRNKLRALGTDVISDVHLIKQKGTREAVSLVLLKIAEIMSFLDIASTVNIISEMNGSILRKEFTELDRSIKESVERVETVINRRVDLSDFFKEETISTDSSDDFTKHGNIFHKGHDDKGHIGHTRIGVQKGSTLMKALSDKITPSFQVQDFDLLKKQRRFDIISFISKNGGSATITDIKNGALSSFNSTGEKTLQRELISMVKDDVLEKTGGKRWSKYSLKKTTP